MPTPVSATSTWALLAVAPHADVDVAAWRRVLDGVVDQDQQHLLQAIRVGLDGGVRRRLGVQRRAGRPGSAPAASCAAPLRAATSAMLERRGHQLELARVRARQRQQVLRQPLHARDLGAHVVEQLAVVLERLVAVLVEQVGRRAQHGQRRAQLVRRVGDELLLPLERLLDRNQRAAGQEPGRRRATAAGPARRRRPAPAAASAARSARARRLWPTTSMPPSGSPRAGRTRAWSPSPSWMVAKRRLARLRPRQLAESSPAAGWPAPTRRGSSAR